MVEEYVFIPILRAQAIESSLGYAQTSNYRNWDTMYSFEVHLKICLLWLKRLIKLNIYVAPLLKKWKKY